MPKQSDLVPISGIWINRTDNGNVYMSGYLGNAKILIFKNNHKGDNEKAPDYNLFVAPSNKQKQEPKREESTQAAAELNDEIPF